MQKLITTQTKKTVQVQAMALVALALLGAAYVGLASSGVLGLIGKDRDKADQPIAKGSRLLGVDITASEKGSYAEAFIEAQNLGMDFTTLSLNWDDIEIAPEQYDNTILDIANSFYPAYGTKIALIISPIDTNNLRVPEDLRDLQLDSSTVVQRFNKMLAYVFSRIPDVELVSLTIGNEVDIYLGSEWQQFENFFEQSSNFARTKISAPVGAKVTFDNIFSDQAKSLNEHADVIMVTYYPLNEDFTVQDTSVVKKDFDKLVSGYSEEKIYLLETGYPSGNKTKSNKRKQANFFQEVFRSWDNHKDVIPVINLNWLHDRSPAEIESFKEYYGISDEAFLDYIGSLGFKNYKGKKKHSFGTIINEARSRGWQ